MFGSSLSKRDAEPLRFRHSIYLSGFTGVFNSRSENRFEQSPLNVRSVQRMSDLDGFIFEFVTADRKLSVRQDRENEPMKKTLKM